MEGKTAQLDLSLPEQKLSSLSFCEASPRAFKNWVDALPIANVGESARLLYHAIIELNQLDTPPQQRLRMLEHIRPQVHFTCDQLAQHFIGHSLALTEKQRKVANLAQALQLHLANGYKLVLSHITSNGGDDKQQQITVQSAHRAMSDLGSTILRANQLYCPSPARCWYEIHQIFEFIFDRELSERKVQDSTNHFRTESSVMETYKRLLLLGCCRPNQLRQKELETAYHLFECWTDWTDIYHIGISNALFVVSLRNDAPPVYRNLLKSPLTSNHIGFDSTALAEGLADYLTASPSERKSNGARFPEIPVRVNDALLMHLSQALGILTKRSFKRIASSGRLQVCVGMSALHYYCANQKTFNQFVSDTDEPDDENNIFLSAAQRKNDAWAGAFDADKGDSMVSPDTPINFRGASGGVADGDPTRSAYPWYEVSLENTSPGGYCINWNADMPASLQTGELLGVREQQDHPWSVAIIRWIRQIKKQGTQIGVELLAPNAAPCALRLEQKVGNSSEFLRGLLLPELSSIGQPATMLTPRVPFQTGNRITLLYQGQQRQAQLSRRVSATSSISQFELKFRDSLGAGQTGSGGKKGSADEDDFDSLWDSL